MELRAAASAIQIGCLLDIIDLSTNPMFCGVGDEQVLHALSYVIKEYDFDHVSIEAIFIDKTGTICHFWTIDYKGAIVYRGFRL